MSEQLARLPDLLTSHLQLALVALGIGILVSIPLGVVATRVNWLKRLSVGLASIVQTVPGLALLAIVVPLLTFLGVQDFGYLPAIIALALYSILPILRNTVTGIDTLDPSFIEAARGVGMTLGQQIRMVEIPLAMPVIIAGIRTSTVWVVGIATLSTAVGAPSLGNYIFEGLHIRNTTAVLIGCVAAASLALILDGLVHALEVGLQKRKKKLVAAVLTVFGLLYTYTGYTLARDAVSDADHPVIIGSKAFTEQYILSEILAGWISKKTGRSISQRKSLGSTVAFDALHSGSIDVYIDYSGTIWATIMKRQGVPDDPSTVTSQVKQFLKKHYDIHQVGAFGFENAYTLAVRGSDSSTLQLEQISDLEPHASKMVIGGDYEFFGRPEWAAIRDTYGFEFQKKVPMDPSLMYSAVANQNVDVISAFSTDGRIAAFDLMVLQDDQNAIPPYDALILVRSGLLKEQPEVVEALRNLVDTIDVERMRNMNRAVDELGQSPAQVAGKFISNL